MNEVEIGLPGASQAVIFWDSSQRKEGVRGVARVELR